jgi:hypothetical protein
LPEDGGGSLLAIYQNAPDGLYFGKFRHNFIISQADFVVGCKKRLPNKRESF